MCAARYCSVAELPKDIHQLRKLLKSFGIPVDGWGKGKAKSLSHLLDELNAGESSLTTRDGKIFRQTAVACLNILKGSLVLWEDFQLFYEGGRKRVRKMDSSAGEKLKPGESPEDAVNRLIREEFPVLCVQQNNAPRKLETRCRESESESYPGLSTMYELHFFEIELEIDLPPISVQEPDKLVAYKWVPKA